MVLKPAMLPVTYLEIEGKSENINIGDRVFVIGHLLGLDWTVTGGIISHTNRTNDVTPLVRLIQLDAAVNRGNSGGPVLNEDGKVVGIITTTRFSPKGGLTVGVGNGVRGDHLNRIVLDLMDDGLISRPAMQTKFKHLTPWTIGKLREENPGVVFPDVFGLITIEIKEDSYPYSQGLRNFDIVISVDGVALTNIYELGNILDNRSIGDVLNLTIIREGLTMNLLYTLKNLEFDYLSHFDDRAKRAIEAEDETE
jgi:serine protease Do